MWAKWHKPLYPFDQGCLDAHISLLMHPVIWKITTGFCDGFSPGWLVWYLILTVSFLRAKKIPRNSLLCFFKFHLLTAPSALRLEISAHLMVQKIPSISKRSSSASPSLVFDFPPAGWLDYDAEILIGNLGSNTISCVYWCWGKFMTLL